MTGLTYTDIFCGAGGSSIGMTGAGLRLVLAANHWNRAIETHAANYPDADHLCADVSNYDMRRLPATDVLWASPICTEISPAGGRARRRPRGQLDMLEELGHVPREGLDRTRATFHDVIRATEVHRYLAVIVENVVEAAEWELFDWWLSGMTTLGYAHQFVSVSSAHIGGPGNPYAPQWRDRLYIVFTRKGIRLPDLDPRPPAWCPVCEQVVDGVQVWKRPGARRIGKYRRQYEYRCPNRECRHAVAEPFILPAAAAIDWTDLGTRIGDRPRPLAPKTIARIKAGLAMYGQPVTVAVGGNTWERPGSGYSRTWPALQWPLNARTGTPGEAVVTGEPWITMLRGAENAPTGISDPLAAVTTGRNQALTLPPAFLAQLRGGGLRTIHPEGEPLPSVVTHGGSASALVVPDGAMLLRNYGGYLSDDRNSLPVTGPLGPVTANDHHALVIPVRGKRAKPTTTAAPLHTVATRDSAAMVQPDDADVMDCRFRMLKPREHLRAQRFPDSYIVFGNQGEQTMQAGNAVSANVAHWLGQQVAEALCS